MALAASCHESNGSSSRGRIGNLSRRLCRNRRRVLGDELFEGRRELSTLAAPIGDPLVLEIDRGGAGARIIGANNFDGAAVAGAVLFDDDNPIIGLLAGAKRAKRIMTTVKEILSTFRTMRRFF